MPNERANLIQLLFDQVPENWDENDIGILADALEESSWLSGVIAQAKTEGWDAAADAMRRITVEWEQFEDRLFEISKEIGFTGLGAGKRTAILQVFDYATRRHLLEHASDDERGRTA